MLFIYFTIIAVDMSNDEIKIDVDYSRPSYITVCDIQLYNIIITVVRCMDGSAAYGTTPFHSCMSWIYTLVLPTFFPSLLASNVIYIGHTVYQFNCAIQLYQAVFDI